MKKMKKQARERDALTQLPEPMIHHIQSFLTGKDAARSSYIFKSWYDAWLTRPTLSFDEHDFKNKGFEKIWTQTMERYRAMNLTIESFTLHTKKSTDGIVPLATKLTADAIKIGATDLNIEVPSIIPNFVLPPEVLGSETLARLCLRQGRIPKRNAIRCSSLKSLILHRVCLRSDILRDIFTISSTPIEELMLSFVCTCFRYPNIRCFRYPNIRCFEFSDHLPVLHKLRRLNLESARVGESFFRDFASRFPCLKDLILDHCSGCTRIQIASTSLEHIRLDFGLIDEDFKEAEFDVPNIRKLVVCTGNVPSLCFKACLRELESDISLSLRNLTNGSSVSWLMRLRWLLTNLRESRISLSISSLPYVYEMSKDLERDTVTKTVLVENLTIDTSYPGPSSFLVGLFRVCRPTFIHYTGTTMLTKLRCDLLYFYKTLKQQLATPNFSTDQFDLNLEFYDKILGEWRPFEFTTDLQCITRFHLSAQDQ